MYCTHTLTLLCSVLDQTLKQTIPMTGGVFIASDNKDKMIVHTRRGLLLLLPVPLDKQVSHAILFLNCILSACLYLNLLQTNNYEYLMVHLGVLCAYIALVYSMLYSIHYSVVFSSSLMFNFVHTGSLIDSTTRIE